MNRYTKPLSIGLLLVCSTLFFLGGPGDRAARSIQSAWDMGHVVFFFAATVAWIKWGWRGISASAVKQWALVLTCVAVIGLGIEGAQVFLGRNGDFSDLLRDLVGTVLALAFLGPYGIRQAASARLGLRSFAVVLLLWAVSPLAIAVADEISAAKAFPVLADFETPFQLSRWESDVVLSVEGDTVREGTGALRVPLSTARYSKASLEYFPGDWRDAATLCASVFNPDSDSLELNLRVHDEWHDQRYSDRFNRVFTFAPGWNDLVVPISDIESAPRDRSMDLSRIAGLSFFTVELPKPRTIYIDEVELR